MNEDKCGNCIELEIIGCDEIELEIIGQCEDIPQYAGPYMVIPKRTEQTLDTDQKIMRADVTVKEIPYEETHNAHGITAVIPS